MNEPVTSTCLDLEEVLLLTTAQLQQEEANKTFLVDKTEKENEADLYFNKKR